MRSTTPAGLFEFLFGLIFKTSVYKMHQDLYNEWLKE